MKFSKLQVWKVRRYIEKVRQVEGFNNGEVVVHGYGTYDLKVNGQVVKKVINGQEVEVK